MIYLKKFNESLFYDFRDSWIDQETNDITELQDELAEDDNFDDLFKTISRWSRDPLEERINRFLDKNLSRYSFTKDEINYELNKFLNKTKIVPKNDPEKLNHFHIQLKDLLIDLIEDKTIHFIKMNQKISIEYYFNRIQGDDLDIDTFTDKLKADYIKFNQFKNYINMFKESNPDAKFKYDNSFTNTFSMNIFV